MDSPQSVALVVLVVDDEPTLVPMICEKLSLSGFTPLGAQGPREALKLIQEHQGVIDLLLTDVIMPEMNGRELANRVSQARPGIRVMFMSAYSDQVLTDVGVVPHGTHLIKKPFRLDDLVARIHAVMKVATPWKTGVA